MECIICIIGARPQFIKHAALEIEISKFFNCITIHTGQHFDEKMSDVFFNELGIKSPTYKLSAGGGSHADQTSKMLKEIEDILFKENPFGVVVYGDTNSTLAGSLAAAKLGIRVFHIEAGLRSFNRSMPEEINRVLTDHMSNLLFCPTSEAITNLENEGIRSGVYLVGDVMKDMVRLAIEKQIVKVDRNKKEPYYFATIHRPYNTDNIERLGSIIKSFNELDKKVYFSVHPRTLSRIKDIESIRKTLNNIIFLPPVSYFESLNYQINSDCVITDSGGMQKEAYLLKKRCITIRSETEWVETLEGNWNSLVFDDLYDLQRQLKIIPGFYNDRLYGDGHTSKKICSIILNEA